MLLNKNRCRNKILINLLWNVHNPPNPKLVANNPNCSKLNYLKLNGKFKEDK